MTTEQEWQDLPNMQEVACAQADGWEIEWRDPLNYPHWEFWDGKGWSVRWQFRGRPRKPAMKKVKMLCWINSKAELVWRDERWPMDSSIRVQSEDKEIEVPA